MYHWSLILRSFRAKPKLIEDDANGFVKALCQFPHLWILNRLFKNQTLAHAQKHDCVPLTYSLVQFKNQMSTFHFRYAIENRQSNSADSSTLCSRDWTFSPFFSPFLLLSTFMIDWDWTYSLRRFSMACQCIIDSHLSSLSSFFSVRSLVSISCRDLFLVRWKSRIVGGGQWKAWIVNKDGKFWSCEER